MRHPNKKGLRAWGHPLSRGYSEPACIPTLVRQPGGATQFFESVPPEGAAWVTENVLVWWLPLPLGSTCTGGVGEGSQCALKTHFNIIQ